MTERIRLTEVQKKLANIAANKCERLAGLYLKKSVEFQRLADSIRVYGLTKELKEYIKQKVEEELKDDENKR